MKAGSDPARPLAVKGLAVIYQDVVPIGDGGVGHIKVESLNAGCL